MIKWLVLSQEKGFLQEHESRVRSHLEFTSGIRFENQRGAILPASLVFTLNVDDQSHLFKAAPKVLAAPNLGRF